MQRVIEEADEAEPLLSQQLYDSLREARQRKLDLALEAARQLLGRGAADQAELAESRAREGIEDLREGVERAAQSVLGDETEALRRAQEVLEGLAEQVDDEMRRGQARERGEQPGAAESIGQRSDAQRPIAGEGFREWSDRLRDVEEMVEDADLRARAARIRDSARGIRNEFRRRNFKGPNWDLVQDMVAAPLADLRDRVAEELARRSPKEMLVPIDRDPVPPKYADRVRRYYETLGSGR
jgi:hypothetical protein